MYELTEEARERMEESSECRLEELSEYRPKVVLEEEAEAKEKILFWKAIFRFYDRAAVVVELMLDIYAKSTLRYCLNSEIVSIAQMR